MYTVKYSGGLSPRPEVCEDGRIMSPEEVAAKLNSLRDALTEAAEWIRTRDDFKVSASQALKPIETLLKELS